MITIHPWAHARTWILAAAVLASAACRGPAAKSEDTTPTAGTSSAEVQPASAASGEATRLRASVASIARNCEIERDRCVVQRCAHDEDRTLQAELDAGALGRTSILDAWSELLRDDVPVVATGDGALELLQVKPEGKKSMDGPSFLRGARLSAGTRLGGSA